MGTNPSRSIALGEGLVGGGSLGKRRQWVNKNLVVRREGIHRPLNAPNTPPVPSGNSCSAIQ